MKLAIGFRSGWRVALTSVVMLTVFRLFSGGTAQATLSVLVDNGGTSFNITEYDFNTGTYLGLFTTYSMQRPLGMTADSTGNVYVADIGANTIEKFAPNGTHLATFTSPNLSDNEGMVVYNGILYSASYNTGNICTFSLSGSNLGVFATVDSSGLQGMVADASGNLYVADYNGASYGHTIQKVATNGTVTTFASVPNPIGMAIDSSGNIYASDPIYGHTINKISPAGTSLGSIVSSVFDYYMTMGSNDTIYAPLTTANTIEKYSSSGTDLGAFTTTGLDSPGAVLIIPEPSTALLLGAGAAALVLLRRRKH